MQRVKQPFIYTFLLPHSPATYRVILQLLSNKERCASKQLYHVYVGQSGRTVHRSVRCSSLSESFDIVSPQLSPAYRLWCPVVTMSSCVYAWGMNLPSAGVERLCLCCLATLICPRTKRKTDKRRQKELMYDSSQSRKDHRGNVGGRASRVIAAQEGERLVEVL